MSNWTSANVVNQQWLAPFLSIGRIKNANCRASELEKVEYGHQELMWEIVMSAFNLLIVINFFFLQRQAFGQLWFRCIALPWMIMQ